MRIFIASAIFALLLVALASPVSAQTNPLPFVHNPTVPAAIAPGGPPFTITVNGAGFVSGATVLWNGQARVTMFVSATQVTASLLASDIATANLAAVMVANPGPGGGASNAVLFSVATPVTSPEFMRSESAFGATEVSDPTGLAAGSSPTDGSYVLVVANGKCPLVANCILDDGTIAVLEEHPLISQDIPESPQTVVTADFYGDGVPDFLTIGAVSNSSTGLVTLGAPGATFLGVKPFTPPSGSAAMPTPVVGDFNRDGHLDLVMAGGSAVYFVPGNGDGTFGTAIPTSTGSAAQGGLAAGDFNGDGILDLAVTNPPLNLVSILIGNGDGTYKPPVNYATGSSPSSVVTGDFNGDGKLDLAILDGSGTTISILLGNGDGTFKPKVDYPAGISAGSLTLGDFNGDGILDLAVSDTQCTTSGCPATGSVNILLGNGNGTFQTAENFAAGGQPDYVVTTGEVNNLPPTGLAGIAVANVADNTISIFSPQGQQTGPGNPLPTLSQLSPAFAVESSGAFTLTVNGTNFIPASTISFGGQTETPTFVSSTQLTALIQDSQIASVGPITVFVSSPAPGGGDSAGVAFHVLLPAPTISSITPSSALAGSPGFTLAINGQNFVNGSTVNFNGVSRSAAYNSISSISTAVAASDVANAATILVSVTNPLNVNNGGGGTSSTLPLTVLVNNSQPTVGVLTPASTTAGAPAFTLQIVGTGFGPSSVVTFGSLTIIPTYVSPDELVASIPASAVAHAGTPLVTVTNPGGNPSVAATFTVNNPAPQGIVLAPTSAAAGSAALPLNVTGSDFITSSSVLINVGTAPPTALPTTYVSSTLLQATLPASDLAQGGTLNISVNNPAPGGGTTAAISFTVVDYSVTPPSSSPPVTAGQTANFVLTLSPSNGTFPSPVTFSLSPSTPLPAGASASFSPSATVTPGANPKTVTLEITTTPHTAGSAPHFPREDRPILLLLSLNGLALALAGLVLRTSGRRVRRIAPQFLLTMLLVAAAGLVACGGGGSYSTPQLNPATGTPAGTYTITVLATSGGVSHSTTVTLTVM